MGIRTPTSAMPVQCHLDINGLTHDPHNDLGLRAQLAEHLPGIAEQRLKECFYIVAQVRIGHEHDVNMNKL